MANSFPKAAAVWSFTSENVKPRHPQPPPKPSAESSGRSRRASGPATKASPDHRGSRP